ncbi:MAG: hypothetical protein CFH06_00212 [Alphaproteobacteria bacterium MarineAlpha3_Bin5]|nr:MAG: hypothetical protein CFH06_00212 [Alphaproteobacteria bacterium MarineAlpha3_Bin5]
MDTNRRISDLIAISERLIDILKRENKILIEYRHAELNGLVEEKEALSRIYETRIKALTDSSDDLNSVETVLHNQLRDLGTLMNGLMLENGRLLHAAMTASRGVLDAVADAIRDTAHTAGTYSNTGVKEQPRRAGVAQNTSLSLDQTL